MDWISVKDRLPEKDIPVLAFSEDGVIQVVVYYHHAYRAASENIINGVKYTLPESKELQSWSCTCEDSYYQMDRFTHWMPLPEPPKEKK